MNTFLRSLLASMLLLVLCMGNSIQAQCPNNNNPTACPAFDASTLVLGNRTFVCGTVWGGEYQRVTNITAGNTYRVDFCVNGANSTTYDSYLTLYTSGGSLVGFNDNFCGDDGQLDFVAPVGGEYWILADVGAGCGSNATSSAVSITLLSAGCTGPTIITHPTTNAGCPNLGYNFTSTTSASPDSVRWQVSTNGGSSWTNISNGAPYSGATTTTLTINPAPIGFNGYLYRMRVFKCSPVQSATSNGASLIFNDATNPTITACPGTQTLALNSSCQASLPDYTPLASFTDNCSGTITKTQSPTAGTTVSGPGSLVVSLFGTDVSGNQATCTFNVTTTSPEINVIGNSTTIVSGDVTPSSTDHTDFGSVLTCTGTIVRTFTIQNTASAGNLTVGAISITGANAADFSLTVSPAGTVSPSFSTNFSITFNPSANGVRSATVSIPNNDCNENPYTFAIQGTGNADVVAPTITCPGTQTLALNGSCQASLPNYTPLGSASDNCPGSPVITQSPIPGTVVSGGGSQTITLTATDGSGNSNFCTFSVTKTTPVAQLEGNSIVIPLNDVTPTTIDGTDFGSAMFVSGTVVRSFTIRNTGNQSLSVSSIAISGAQAADFTVSGISFPAVIPASGSTTFTITFDPSALGIRNATATVNSNDCTNGPYSFAIRGTGTGSVRWFVDHTAVGANNGTSWANAFTSFQSAVAAAVSGDTVLVAKGTHKPSVGGAGRMKRFILVEGVKYYGGFPNGGGTFSQRDFNANRTILSGDIGNLVDSTDNCFVVVDASDKTTATLMSGFTVEEGNADSTGVHMFSRAGGIYLHNTGSMKLDSVTVRNNFGRSGAAIYTAGPSNWLVTGCQILNNNGSSAIMISGASTGTFSGCTFTGNVAGNGGAIQFNGTSGMTLNNCQFNNNVATASGGGGAVSLGSGSNTFNNCTFQNNSATGGPGGAVYKFVSNTQTFNDCIFIGNVAANTGGGAAYTSQGGYVFNRCAFTGNSTTGASTHGGAIYSNGGTGSMVNCAFFQNFTTQGLGGAFYNNTGGTQTVTNCSFARNSAGGFTQGGAWNNNSNSNATIRNSIFWGNTANGNDGPANTEIGHGSGTLTVTNTIWQGNVSGGTIYNADPLFTNINTGDLTLTLCSPAIDTVNGVGAPADDILSQPRPFNAKPGSFDFDLGAYERQTSAVDNTPPTAVCQNVSVQLNGGGTVSIVAPQVNNGSTDNCTSSGSLGLSVSPSSFTCSNLGGNSVTLTVTDQSNNSSTCNATVTVLDSIRPTVTCPGTQQVFLNGTCNASMPNFTSLVTANDNCTTIASTTQSPTAGTTLSGTGSTLVTMTVTDGSGNTRTCNFSVTRTDSTDPVLTCPANQVVNAVAGICAATASFGTATGTDNCGSVTVNQTGGPTNGGTLNLGLHTITFTGTDASGNTGICSFTITVQDTFAPLMIHSVCQLDNSLSPAYGDGWQNGDNGGGGFSAWNLAASTGNPGQAGFFVGNSTGNGAGVDSNGDNDINASGVALGMYANSSQATQASRNFTQPFLVGSTFSFDFDNGFVDNGQIVGVQFRNASGQSLGEVRFRGGQPTYEIVDANGITPFSSIPFTDEAIHINFVSIANGYARVALTRQVNGAQQFLTMRMFSPGGGQVPAGFMVFNSNAGAGSTNDLYINYFQVCNAVAGCPPNQTVAASPGTCGTVIGHPAVQAMDNCSYFTSVTQTVGLPNGSNFPVGTTTNTYTTVDGAGNTASCSFNITVTDNQNPAITCPSNITAFAGASCNAVVTYSTPVGTDNCPGSTTVQLAGLASGATYPLGLTTNQFRVTDAAGNLATCSFTVTVSDTTDPVITCPSTQTLPLGPGCSGSLANYTSLATASDNCGPLASLTQSPAAGTVVSGVGATTVTLTATDNTGNIRTCTFNVNRTDTTSPSITCPSNQTIYLGGGCSLNLPNFTGLASATDGCTGSPTVTQSPSPGTVQSGGGISSIILTATDGAGNSTNCSFQATRTDTTSPNAICRNITAYLNSGTTTVFPNDVNNGSNDNCGIGGLSNSPAVFTCQDIGNQIVTLTVTDNFGNTSTCQSIVSVVDTAGFCCPAAVITSSPSNVTTCPNGSITFSGSATGLDSLRWQVSTNGGSSWTFLSNNSPYAGVTTNTLSISPAASGLSGNLYRFVAFACTPVKSTNSGSALLFSADTTAPTMTCPSSQFGFLNSMCQVSLADYTGQAMASDACDFNPVFTQIPAPGTVFTGASSQSLTMVATDASGNSRSCNFSISIFDTIIPIAICQNLTVFLDGTGNVSVTGNDVAGGSTDNCGVASISLSQTAFNCNDIGLNTVTALVTDVNGSSGSCTATITVQDTTSPNAACQPATVYLDVNGQATLSANAVNNGSTDECGVDTLILSQNQFDCNDIAGLVPLTNDLFFSEYIEGSGNNKCVEIFNGTGSPINLSAGGYELRVYFNGSNTPTIFPLNGVVNSGDVFVFCGSASAPAMLAQADQTNSASLWNGDDGLGLAKAGVLLDIIGRIGEDPGTTWTGGPNQTLNQTLIRNANVVAGVSTNPPSGFPTLATQWSNLPQDNSTNLGSHTYSPPLTTSPTVVLTVQDGSGNTDNCSATVTVLDTLPPTAVCQNITVYLSGAGVANITALNVEGGSTDNCSISNSSISANTFNCSQLGANSVTLTITDNSGNTATCQSTVTVSDTISPVAVCQVSTVYLDGSGNGLLIPANLNDGSTDNCSIANFAASTTNFTCSNVGNNNVVLTVTDPAGNSSTCTSIVQVLDTLPPVATCPSNITVNNSPGNCNAIVTYSNPTTTDNCPGVTIFRTTGFPSGFPFPVGATVNTFVAADPSGNSDTCSFTVTVVDNQNPTLVCPANITANNDPGQCSAVRTFTTPTATDNCALNPIQQTAGLSSGSAFPVGTTVNTFTVTDVSGNSATCSFSVTVLDAESPTMTCPGADTLYLNNSCQAAMPDYIVTTVTTDNCPGTLSFSQSTPSGTLVTGAGSVITVTVSATDVANNTGSCTVQVTLLDTINPTITCPSNQTEFVNGSCALALPDYTSLPITADNCSGTLTVTQFPAIGTVINGAGTNTGVTLTVTDQSGNAANCGFTVQQLDNTAPVVTCPVNSVLYADGSCQGALLDYRPGGSVADNCDPSPSFTQVPAPGTLLNGHNASIVVWLIGGDASGNLDSCSFTVTLLDTTAPALNCPANISVGNDLGQCGAVVTYTTPNGTDNCAGANTAQTQGLASGSTFPVGTTTQTFVATDGAGNTTTCSFDITVSDTEAPVWTNCPNNIVQNIDSTQCDVQIVWTAPLATDNCLPDTVYSTAQPGDVFAPGVSTVTYTVVDVGGDTATCSFTVTVNQPAFNINPTAVVMLNGFNVSCNGVQDGSASANAAGGCLPYTYNWSNGQSTGTINGLGAGTYYVTVTDGAGNTQLDSITLTQPAPIAANFISFLNGGPNNCQGDTVVLGGAAGYAAYLWSTGQTTTSITVLQTGLIELIVTDSNGCQGSDTVNIQFSPWNDPLPTINPGGQLSVCQGDSLWLDVGGGYFNYAWNTGDTVRTILVTQSGSYWAQVMNGFGCVRTSDTVNVTVLPLPPAPVITQSGNVLTSTPGNQYQWYLGDSVLVGAEGQSYTMTASGDYSVVVTDSNGCSNQSNVISFLVSVGEGEMGESLQIFPNPFASTFTIDLRLPEAAEISAELYAVNGTKVWEGKTAGSVRQYREEVSLNEVSNGIYFLRLSVGGRVIVQKVVKQ